MNIWSKLLILSFFFCTQVRADSLNYKNLNTLAGLICHEFQTEKGGVYISKISVDRNELKKGHFEYNLSGTCNAKVSKNKITSLGEELQITFTEGKKLATGKLGMKDVKVYLQNSKPYRLEVWDTLFAQKTALNIKGSRWSKDNMIFTTTPILIRQGKRKIASENASKLLFKDNHFQLFNIWNYESFGCSKSLSQTKCEALVKGI